MAELRIKVGASVDRSVEIAFQPLIAQAKKAASAVEAAGRKGGAAVAGETRKGTSAADKEFAKLAKSAERWQRDMVKAAEKASRDELKASEAWVRGRIRDAEKVTKARERENDKILRDVERTERAAAAAAEKGASARTRASERGLQRAQRQSDRDANRYAGAAYRAGARTIGAGVGFSKDVARGMGVDLDMGSLMTKGTSLEKSAVDLSNSAFMPGKGGANGQRQDSRALVAETRKVAMATGTESGDVMAGLQAFVGKTGDLETGRAALFDLARLSKATGTNMEDMIDAAGDVSNALGDMPSKGAAVQSVMRAIAAQGKEGAVEIKQLATQMAKLGAASGQFTGTREQAIADMGALVQMTRAKGGAASSTQAATSVMSFTQSFSKGARLDKFAKYGVAVESADGKNRRPQDIIIDAIRATKGDNRKMGEMFADAGARRVTRGYETTYREAGGGEAGIKAVERAFGDLARATVLQTEIDESFARSMQTSDAKAKVFNEQLGLVATELQSGFLPALQALAPVMVSTGGKFADWISELTGAKEKKQRTDEVGTENVALNASSSLRQVLETGRSVGGETDQAVKARTALEQAIAVKKRQVEEESNFGAATSDGTFAPRKKLSHMTTDELNYAAKNDERAEVYQRDKQQLERMQDTLGTLDGRLQTAMTRALEGSVITVNLKDPLRLGVPSISTGAPTGVEPPPGAPGRGP